MKDDIDFTKVLLSCGAVGLAIAIVGAIPLLRLPNVCCLWIIVGGYAAAYFSSKSTNSPELMDGAVFGGIFGIIYGITVNVTTFMVNIPLNLMGVGSSARGTLGEGILNRLGVHLGLVMLGDIAVIIVNIILGIVFGAVGGMLYAFVSEGSAENKKTMFPKGPQGKARSKLGGI
jgi:hypothetical protein